MESVFLEFATVLTVAAVVGAIGTLLRQPLIISFIVVGLLLGPSGLGLVQESTEVRLLAQMGIALLLFVVGLKLDLGNIRTMGPVALATGMGQVVFTSFFGFLIALGFGLSVTGAVYVAVALALSSTIIIIKLLTDKREIDSLHGRITVGILIVQDMVVIAAMIVLAAFGAVDEGNASIAAKLALIGLKSIGLLLGIAILMRWVMPPLMHFLSRSQELLVLFAVAWAVFLAVVSHRLGLSTEVGAFLAGVALASTQYREALAARLATLRDFLLLFFFIDLGAGLDPSMLRAQVSQAVVFSLFVLVGNPLIVMAIMGVMGYRSRTSFFTGTAMAQISEFSLIIAALGVSLGHISTDTLGLVTLVGLVTIGLSTYLITYSAPIYDRLVRFLSLFERREPFRELAENAAPEDGRVDVIVLGLGRFGGGIARGLQLRQRRVLGVDFDPDTLALWRRRGLPVIYGDISDPELVHHLPVDRSTMVVCAVPGRDANLTVLRALEHHGFTGRTALTATLPEEAEALRRAGADLVLEPFAEAAEQAAEAITAAMHRVRERVHLPLSIAEVRLPAGSALAGRRLREIPVRAETGASVIGVSRAGKVLFDPEPDLQLFPGDHLVLIGSADDLMRAREYLERQEFAEQAADEFVIREVELAEGAEPTGRSLAEMDFRNRYGATVIGIARGEGQFLAPDPHEPLRPGDRLFVAGRRSVVEQLRL